MDTWLQWRLDALHKFSRTGEWGLGAEPCLLSVICCAWHGAEQVTFGTLREVFKLRRPVLAPAVIPHRDTAFLRLPWF